MTAAIDPVTAAELWLAPARVETSAVLFVIGLGDGHVLDALDRRRWSGHVVALEREASAAAACLKRKPVCDWHAAGRLTVFAGPEYTGLDKALAALPLATEKPVIAGNPEAARANREACIHAARTVSRAWFGARANDEARKQNAGRYLLNTLRNANAIVREGDVSVLNDLFTGAPALVVGAGPSLDRNIADIARYRDRVVMVAADTALRPLLAVGIEPDVVVATDPSETNARHLNDLPPCERTHLVAEGSVDPESLHHFTGRTFFLRIADHHPWPWLRQAGHDRGRLRAWGSVLTTAFDLALTMGCEPIVFAGADLAFTGGRPYARGTTYEEVWRHAEMWGQPIEDCWSAAITGWPDTREIGVTGQTVQTAPHLRSFRDWIAAEAAKATGRTLINGTGGGILAGSGIVQQPLSEALSTLPALGAGVRGRIDKARRSRDRERSGLIGEPDEATLLSWQAFAGSEVHRDSVATALGRQPLAPLPPAPEAGEPTAEPQSGCGEVVLECLPSVDLSAAIETAWREMGPANHRLILRDCTGNPAGATVRRALFAFLEHHPEVSGRFGRFFDPEDDRSWIDRRSASELCPGEDRDKWQDDHAEVANRLTALIVEQLAPASVLDLGCGAGHWLRAFAAHGVVDVVGVESNLERFTASRSFDLCLCLGVVQLVTMAAAEAVIATCTKASDTVLFSVPSAAVGAPGFINERPSTVWHKLFLQHGFAAHDELRPVIEARFGGYRSSYDLVTVYRRVASCGDDLTPATRAALLAAASRADDLVLQTHWYRAHAMALATSAARLALPGVSYESMPIEAHRMEAGGTPGVRMLRFRTAAAALAMTTGFESLAVSEDGRPLRRVEGPESVAAAPGTFAIQQGAITFRSLDGSDPRRNRRRYTVALPAHVAWLEQQSLAVILEHRL